MKSQHVWVILGAVVLWLWYIGALAPYGFPSSPVVQVPSPGSSAS